MSKSNKVLSEIKNIIPGLIVAILVSLINPLC